MLSAFSRIARAGTSVLRVGRAFCQLADTRADIAANMFALAERPNNLGIQMIMTSIKDDRSLADVAIDGETLLMRAMRHMTLYNSRLARELLPVSNIYHTGALKYYSNHTSRRVHGSALHRALASTDREMIHLILTKMETESKYPVRQLEIKEYFNKSKHLLALAIDNCHPHTHILRLIGLGADVNGEPYPLEHAVCRRDDGLVRTLLLAGADKGCHLRRRLLLTDDWKTANALRGFTLVPFGVHAIDDY